MPLHPQARDEDTCEEEQSIENNRPAASLIIIESSPLRRALGASGRERSTETRSRDAATVIREGSVHAGNIPQVRECPNRSGVARADRVHGRSQLFGGCADYSGGSFAEGLLEVLAGSSLDLPSLPSLVGQLEYAESCSNY